MKVSIKLLYNKQWYTTFYFNFLDVTITLQPITAVIETSSYISVCVQLSDVPDDGLEVDIVVDISTKDNTATSNNSVNKQYD